uniref:Phage protein n=1 Tax=Steinernema glaseri TaxID=37863 RepID=A0A1I7Y7U2_9BILA
MEPGFSDFLNTLTDKQKQAADWSRWKSKDALERSSRIFELYIGYILNSHATRYRKNDKGVLYNIMKQLTTLDAKVDNYAIKVESFQHVQNSKRSATKA